MSQEGDGECCAVRRESWRVARKEHKCHACGETIAAGHKYHATFSVFYGNPHQTNRCMRCQAIFDHLSARIRQEGREWEFCDAELDCGHTYRERWGQDPPAWVAALAFWRPGDPLPEAKEDKP